MPKYQVEFKNTKFVPFIKTNFSGDPDRSNYKSTTREGFIMIPDQELALRMRADGFNIKETRPQEEETDFTPDYYVAIKLNFHKAYDTMPDVKVILITPEGINVELDEDSVREIDRLWDNKAIKSVTCLCNMRFNTDGRNNTLYVQEMRVEQAADGDPYANYFRYN